MVKSFTHSCHHCGTACSDAIRQDAQVFCCEGCKLVFQLLDEKGLCQFYDLQPHAGLKAKGKFTSNDFAYLNDPDLLPKLANFHSDTRVNIRFHIPAMHCVSCIYLLENLHQINPAVYHTSVQFNEKNVLVAYDPRGIKLQELVELLSFIGYPPDIRLDATSKVKASQKNQTHLIQLGVAGFCFSNIMMLSFPEYFSDGLLFVSGLKPWFSWIIFALSLPVLFYSAAPFFKNAYRGLRRRSMHIDAPIVLASLITFSRSYYEIITGTGAGYLDSGTGIIFFLLIGRWFQDFTQQRWVFDRTFRSYFPLGVTIQNAAGDEQSITLDKLKVGDLLITRSGEIIPADVELIEGEAAIDYHFVDGENRIQSIETGALIFAGGKQMGGKMLSRVVVIPEQSYFISLWNNPVFSKTKQHPESFIHPWSRWFTVVLFNIAICTAIYWAFQDQTQLWQAVTAILIVACPCSLLLTSTFTHGNMMRQLNRLGLHLKHAAVIDSLSSITDIILDKTGTLTRPLSSVIHFVGEELDPSVIAMIAQAAQQSAHPLSRQLAHHLKGNASAVHASTCSCTEQTGDGILVNFSGDTIKLGSKSYILDQRESAASSTEVHIRFNDQYMGYFQFAQDFRPGLEIMLPSLERTYRIHVLSGDQNNDKFRLEKMLGSQASIHFNMRPADKVAYIQSLQSKGRRVLMVGDGLNDAGALMQAEVGIAVNNNQALFTPASDAILEGNKVSELSKILRFAGQTKALIAIGFVVSILYNIIGISLAVQNMLSPMLAAILMPSSSITLILLSWVLTHWAIKLRSNKQINAHQEITNQTLNPVYA
jgi:Cu+-exporting ATPase